MTPDGRYFVVRGRLWRRADPRLGEEERVALVAALMRARREVGAALRAGDAVAERAARAEVDRAKVALGERGSVWWSDGAPDLNRTLVRNSPYAGWFASLPRPESDAMTIKAVLFDIDGTLVDSNDQHVLAWGEVFRAEGVEIDGRAIHDQIGKGADMLVPALLPGSDAATRERLGDAHGEVYKAKYLGAVQPFPGARALIERVAASGRAVVLASSASAEELEHYLDLLGVRDLVTATTSADDVAHTKPAPDIFAAALAKVAPIAAGEALVVGDTPYDIEAAAKCGIGAVAVRSGKFGDDALSAAGALAIYDDVAALLASFDRSSLAD